MIQKDTRRLRDMCSFLPGSVFKKTDKTHKSTDSFRTNLCDTL